MVKRTDLKDETMHRTKQRIELNEQTYMKHTELNEHQWWATHNSNKFFPSLVLSFSSLCHSLFLQFCFLLPLSLFFFHLLIPIPFLPSMCQFLILLFFILHVPIPIHFLLFFSMCQIQSQNSLLLACHVAGKNSLHS